jgi:hypothetical protein
MTDTVEPTVEERQAAPGRRPPTGTLPRGSAAPPHPDGSRKPTVWPPLLVLLAGVGVLALVLLDGPDAVRAVAVLAYLAVIPGLALVRLIRLPDRVTEFVIAVAVSLALGILVAQAMVQLRRWSPLLGLCVLVTVASLAALLELLRYGRAARRGSRRVPAT